MVMCILTMHATQALKIALSVTRLYVLHNTPDINQDLIFDWVEKQI